MKEGREGMRWFSPEEQGGPPVRAIPASMVGGKEKIPHIFHVSECIFQGSCRKKKFSLRRWSEVKTIYLDTVD